VLGLALVVGASAAGCGSTKDGESVGSVEQDALAIDRMLIGRAAEYPADKTMRARLPVLDASMVERRKMAWDVVAKMLAPVVAASNVTLPRMQTWYSVEDVLPMFDRLFRALPDPDKVSHARFSESEIEAVFPWNATMAQTLASFTAERLAARQAELSTPSGAHSLGKDARVLMSPAYVAHLLRSYPEITSCQVPPASEVPPSATNFAPCLDGEFPVDAAAVKLRWMPASTPLPTYDTSPMSLAAKLTAGKFGDGDGTADPTENDIYSMQLTPDTSMRLAAVHVMTKELRDWAWITLWWSDDPTSDFGSDRPASITALGGPWGHYKMCVVTGYEDQDLTARMDANDPSSWCSNPYLEQGDHAAKTSCIGCHQHGGTAETTASILETPASFPDGARTKLRQNFPADYAFTTTAGLDIASLMKAKIDALTPP
jgi:hypothetical protein